MGTLQTETTGTNLTESLIPLPKLTYPLKIDGWKNKFPFEIFRGHELQLLSYPSLPAGELPSQSLITWKFGNRNVHHLPCHFKFYPLSGWCEPPPTLLLICLSFTRKNGHLGCKNLIINISCAAQVVNFGWHHPQQLEKIPPNRLFPTARFPSPTWGPHPELRGKSHILPEPIPGAGGWYIWGYWEGVHLGVIKCLSKQGNPNLKWFSLFV